MSGAQCRSSSTAGAKGSSRRAAEPPLKVLHISILSPLGQKSTPSPPIQGDVGNDRFRAEGVRTPYLPMRSSPPGLFLISFKTLISRRWRPYALRRL